MLIWCYVILSSRSSDAGSDATFARLLQFRRGQLRLHVWSRLCCLDHQRGRYERCPSTFICSTALPIILFFCPESAWSPETPTCRHLKPKMFPKSLVHTTQAPTSTHRTLDGAIICSLHLRFMVSLSHVGKIYKLNAHERQHKVVNTSEKLGIFFMPLYDLGASEWRNTSLQYLLVAYLTVTLSGFLIYNKIS